MPHLLLQLENTVHERLARGRAARHVNIHRDDSVTSSCHRVAVMVVSSSVRAATHRNDPSRVRHLVVHLSQGRGHLVCESSGDNHNIGLTWRSTENDTEAILVVSWRRQMHHLDSAAGETEGHRPEGTLASPVCDYVQSRAVQQVSMALLLPRTVISLTAHIGPRPCCLPGCRAERWSGP